MMKQSAQSRFSLHMVLAVFIALLHASQLSAAPPCGTKKGGPCPTTNQPPTAVISGPTIAIANAVVTLSAVQSSDPEGDQLNYEWQLESGPTVTFSTTSGVSTDVTLSGDGTYRFTLTVTELQNVSNSNYLSDTTTHTITVGTDNPPTNPTTLMPKCGTSGTLSERVNNCLSQMSLDDKIGQMAMGDHVELKSADHVVSFKLGALLAGGGHAPDSGNLPEDWQKMVDRYQQDALSTDLGIPLLFGIDAIHGHNNVFGATIFPHNIGLGATRDADLACRIGQATAREVAATGINWNFSPTLCVTRDERWGRSYECFGETPAIPSLMTSIIGGYQGTGQCTDLGGLAAPDTVLATAKHWVGDGGTIGGVDQGDTPNAELEALHIPPYLPALDVEDVGSVMISYNSVDGVKMHADPRGLVSNRLKGASGLAFDGIVLSDWTGIKQIDRNFSVGIEQAINGGIDMAMEPYNYDSFVNNLTDLVQTGVVSMERIDDAVSRILSAKVKLGLFDAPYGRQYSDAEQTQPINPISLNVVGSPAHRTIAREAVRKSLVLLKNDNRVLPVNAGSANYKIVVAGKSADDIGNQSGGWTISWQGDSGDITLGDTIYDGVVEQFAGQSNVDVGLNVSPRSNVNGDFGIVVVGEVPYAEGKGDDDSLVLGRKDVSAIEAVCNNMPCAVVLIAGRPLIITDLVDNPNVDAIVAAWLPGTEGGGVADVLFGDYDFTGQLPVSWPATMNQVPINVGDAGYGGSNAPLYPMPEAAAN